MAGYLIANIEVTDAKTFEDYRNQVAPIIARFGGRYLVRGGATVMLEGAAAKRLVVIEFPTLDAARAFYDSAEYAPVLALRLASAASDIVLVEGYQAPESAQARMAESR